MAENRFRGAKDFRQVYGVSASGLRQWASDGRIQYILTPGGHRKYSVKDVEQLLTSTGIAVVPRLLRRGIVYARVSSAKQKQSGDLDRQISSLRTHYPEYTLIQDVGSGINFTRPGFCSLLNQIQSGVVSECVVTNKDRLCRFAFDLLAKIFEFHGSKIVIINQPASAEPDSMSELAEDLIAITTVFISRYHGRRRNKPKPDGKSGTPCPPRKNERGENVL